MIQKILKFLLATYFLLMPLIYVSYIIYRRLIIARLPRELFVPLSSWQIFFILLAIFFCLMRIKDLVIMEGYLKEKEPKNVVTRRLKNLSVYISKHITTICSNFYAMVVGIRLNAYFILLIFVKNVCKIYPPTVEFIVIGLEIIPKLFVLLCFIIDVFIFHKFHYFYNVLWLLLLPLCLRVLKYCITQFHKQHETSMIDLITSKPIPGSDFHEFCFKDSEMRYAFIKNIDDFIENHFYPVFDLNFLLAHYYIIRILYNFNKIELVIRLLYLIGWVTILLFGTIII